MKIILASASPRRQELLHNIFNSFDILTSACEEHATFETPSQYVMDLARQKADDVAVRYANNPCQNAEETLVIGADTIVYSDGCVLGKPSDKSSAQAMLRSLSGKDHHVFTGVSVVHLKDGQKSFHNLFACTKVSVAMLSDEEISAYTETSDPYDKAGSYGIQGYFSRHILGIEGDYFNVVGLPVNKLYETLKDLNLLHSF